MIPFDPADVWTWGWGGGGGSLPPVGVLRVTSVVLSAIPADEDGVRVADVNISGTEISGAIPQEARVESYPGLTIFPIKRAVPEGSTRYLTCSFKDENGDPLTDADQVSSILLTLVDDATNEPVDGLNGVEVKNAAGGELDNDGAFRYKLTPDATAAIGTNDLQLRRLLLDITFDGVENKETHTVYFWVRNQPDV